MFFKRVTKDYAFIETPFRSFKSSIYYGKEKGEYSSHFLKISDSVLLSTNKTKETSLLLNTFDIERVVYNNEEVHYQVVSGDDKSKRLLLIGSVKRESEGSLQLFNNTGYILDINQAETKFQGQLSFIVILGVDETLVIKEDILYKENYHEFSWDGESLNCIVYNNDEYTVKNASIISKKII